jgi:hypothetical protein
MEIGELMFFQCVKDWETLHVDQGSKGKATLLAQKFANNRQSIQLRVFVLFGHKRVADPPSSL